MLDPVFARWPLFLASVIIQIIHKVFVLFCFVLHQTLIVSFLNSDTVTKEDARLLGYNPDPCGATTGSFIVQRLVGLLVREGIPPPPTPAQFPPACTSSYNPNTVRMVLP